MLVLFLMMLVSAAFEVMGIGLIIPYLAVVTNPERILGNPFVMRTMDFFDISGSQEVLIAMTILMIVVFVVKEIVSYFLGVLQSVFVNQCRHETSSRCMAAYLALDYEDYLATDSATIQTTLAAHLFRTHELLFSLLSAMTNVSKALVISVFLFVVDWKIALVLLLGACAVMFLVNCLIKPKVSFWGGQVSDASVKCNKVVNESFTCKKEIEIFNRESAFFESYTDCSNKISKGDNRKQKYAVAGQAVIELSCVLSILLFVLFSLLSGSELSSLLGVLSAFSIAAIRMVPCISSIISNHQKTLFFAPSVHAVKILIDKLDSFANRSAGKDSSSISLEKELRFSNVSFHYKSNEKEVLSNLSFSIQRGQRVGIVGDTGRGKTTLINLMLGLLRPTNGEVSVDGIPVNDGKKRLWLNVGYVPQDCTLLDASVYDNVCFGRNLPMEEFYRVLKMAGADGFVAGMPEKEKTVIGQNGFRLSGGQRQRIGIARALVGTPSLLVFDEATSALDNKTESAVIDTIYALGRGYTIVMIAHRLTTLSGCDTILNLDEI